MARTSFPMLELLGHLAPDPELLSSVLQPSFQLGDFCQSAPYPTALAALLAECGYEFADHGCGMLFASNAGVTLHVDEQPSVLWVLGGQINPDQTSHQLLVGSKDHTLEAGQVVLFDARKRHGVIAGEPGLWAIFSAYVRRNKAQ